MAWLDTTEQLDALLDRIDSRGLFSDSGNGILSVALTLLKSPITNTKEESKVSVGTSSTTAHATESCESVDGSDEKCQASRSSTNRNTGSTDTKNKNTQNDFHLNHREQYDMIKSAADKFDMTLFAASSSPELFERHNIQVRYILYLILYYCHLYFMMII